MSYAPVSDMTKAAILRALADGQNVRAVAEVQQLDPHVITRVASAHGYPDRHKMSWAAGVIERGLDVVDGQPVEKPQAAPAPTIPKSPDSAAPGLLARAAKSQRSNTRRLGARLAADLDRLARMLDDEAKARRAKAAAEARKVREREERATEQARVRKEVAELEARLRELRAGLTKGGSKPVPAALRAGDPKAVRSWAVANGVECPQFGRVPRRVVDAYQAAIGGAS